VDPELRDALDRMAADLRGEIRSGLAETRTDVGERVVASAAEMRRHFGVVGESLRGDIRGLAELMAISIERMDGRIAEQTGRSDSLEGRVLRLEARVSILEDNRKPRRPRRQL
jgi:hypothetical protein